MSYGKKFPARSLVLYALFLTIVAVWLESYLDRKILNLHMWSDIGPLF